MNFPFFIGSARSGTTLIRVIFDSHPEMAIPGESHFIPQLAKLRDLYERPRGFDADMFVKDIAAHPRFVRWKLPRASVRKAVRGARDYPDAIRRLYALFAELKGKPRYGDKTPSYCLFVPEIAALFPDARFVHVIRDGRNTALSIMEAPFGPKRLDQAALFWRRRVEPALDALDALGPTRAYAYRHEDLIDDPPGTVKGICEFLELPFDDQMLRYYENRKPSPSPHMQHLTKPPTKGLRDFRNQMSPDEIELVERICGPTLERLGYERVTDAPAFDEAELDRIVPRFVPAPIKRVRAMEEERRRRLAGKAGPKRPADASLAERARASRAWAELQHRPWGRKVTAAAARIYRRFSS